MLGSAEKYKVSIETRNKYIYSPLQECCRGGVVYWYHLLCLYICLLVCWWSCGQSCVCSAPFTILVRSSPYSHIIQPILKDVSPIAVGKFRNLHISWIFLHHTLVHHVLASCGCQDISQDWMVQLPWNKRDVNWWIHYMILIFDPNHDWD